MPRKDRFETVFDGSVHHVTQRGLNKARILREDGDYAKLKYLIRRYLAIFKVKIYNYCMMPNHVHLLVLAEKADHLSKFMHALSLSYGAYYREKYIYTGYLWQGRFKNVHVDKDSYLLECARYIERNPLRAKYKTVGNLHEYKWSSYNFYANGQADDIITANPLYEGLGKTAEERQAKYKEYILASRPYEEVLDDVFEARAGGSK